MPAIAKATEQDPMLGQAAPDFTNLPANAGKSIGLSDYKGKKLVLYFYPKDDTPGCTVEANDFTRLKDEFANANAVVVGVSKDTCAKHDKFIAKHDLGVDLISDEEGALCEAYGTWVQKSMYGKQYMGIDRATFVIDEEGTVSHVWRKVKAKGHAEAVLEAIQ